MERTSQPLSEKGSLRADTCFASLDTQLEAIPDTDVRLQILFGFAATGTTADQL